MVTLARYNALQWFVDHEELGPDGVFSRKPPSTRMRRLMANQGEVVRQPVGQFEYQNWRLTPIGRAKLGTRPKPRGRRRSLPRIKANKNEEAET